MPKLMIVAGEVSGDMHAARLIAALRQCCPDLSISGIAGDACAAEGVHVYYHVKDMAVMGLTEVLRRYGFFRRVLNEMRAWARKERPTAALLVDYPGFNLRLAATLHAMGIKVIYYICPQVWAWHRSRIPAMARIVDRLITIFPFEPALFEAAGLRTTFAGHPLIDATAAARAAAPCDLPWAGSRRIALLPGSRMQEINRILPVMWQAAALLDRTTPDACFIIAAPSSREVALLEQVLGKLRDGPRHIQVVAGQTREVLRQARAALVASGTATLEAALMECPLAVVYKVTPLTYQLAKRLIRVPHIGMVNIVAGREVCPEFIQRAATPSALAEVLQTLSDATPTRQRMLDDLIDVRERLGEGNAHERAAAIVAEELNG
jgi:lipid-A-disaccharide synthase